MNPKRFYLAAGVLGTLVPWAFFANLYIIDTQGALFSIMPHGLPPAVLAANIRSALRAGEP